MIRFLDCCLASVAVLGMTVGVVGTAKAGQTFQFSYDLPESGHPDTTASGILTTSSIVNSDNSFTITAITGTRTENGVTDTITGLLNPNGYGGNDNELFLVSPFVTENGFSYTTNATTQSGNLKRVNYSYADSVRGNMEKARAGLSFNFTLTPVNATAVPEPTTISLVTIAGVIALGRYVGQRKLKAAA